MATFSRREFGGLLGGALAAGATTGWSALGQGGASPGELTSMTLVEASAKIRARAVTSTELTKAVLARIATYNPKLNCYITVMADEALKQAAALDQEQKAGKLRGPLHGIPIALKDNIDTAGTRTTAASGMFVNRIPTEDADIVRRLKASGAVILGKLNLHEFALGCTGDVSFFGPTRNPWGLEYVTGGSSAGSGAAVAADLCFGALGTDTGGSIRVPSAWCGIVGLKPTTGLVSIRGIVPCAASLDHCGPMARSVEDVALMLTQMTGYDAMDIFSVQHPPADYLAEMKQPVKGFRLGAPPEFYDHLEPEVAAAVKQALDVLCTLTAGITSRAPMPKPEGTGNLFLELGDTANYHDELQKQYTGGGRGQGYMPPTATAIQRLSTNPPSAARSARAHDSLALLRRTIDKTFSDFDLVIVPTTTSSPKKINTSLGEEMGKTKPEVYNFFGANSGCGNTSPFDAYGVPALSLPCGFTKDGLPIGLMIAGPHFAEGRVLALAHAYEQATDWHKRSPALSPAMAVPPVVETETKSPA